MPGGRRSTGRGYGSSARPALPSPCGSSRHQRPGRHALTHTYTYTLSVSLSLPLPHTHTHTRVPIHAQTHTPKHTPPSLFKMIKKRSPSVFAVLVSVAPASGPRCPGSVSPPAGKVTQDRGERQRNHTPDQTQATESWRRQFC